MSGADVRVVPLVPDASTRRFYRHLEDGRTWVAMEYGHPLDASADAYLAVAAYLERHGLPVPRILGVERAEGRVLLSDLGDTMLEAVVAGGVPGAWEPLYEAAVDLLRRLQRAGRDDPDPACPAFGVRLDGERLAWELDYFREHYLEGHRGLRLDAAARDALTRELHALAADVAAQPVALCHRDFHSRNIMVMDGAPWLVDFQDARLGPRTYDLASLLRDAYADVPEAVQERLAERFFGGPLAPAERAELLAAGLQRNLKALGTFGFQMHVKGNARYADAARRTLRHLERTLPLSDGHGELYRVLAPLLPLSPGGRGTVESGI